MSRVALNSQVRGDAQVIQVQVARIDIANVKDFKREVAPLLNDKKRVILDLEHVEFIDSSGALGPAELLACFGVSEWQLCDRRSVAVCSFFD